MKPRANAFRTYFFALGLAFRMIAAGHLLEGIRLLVAPVGYWRFLPSAYTLQEFLRQGFPRVLDVGSPKLLSLLLASKNGTEVHATDLNDEKIFSRWKRNAEAIGLQNYHVEYQDGRRLSYPDSSFDLIYSISVIEHIPENGDVAALAEFRRVLKPNGTLVIEVPYRRKYEEIFLRYDSKGAPLDKPQFYERHYDADQLAQRLASIEGLKLDKRLILGEWLPIDPWIATDRLPRPVRIGILPLEPLLAAVNYWARSDDQCGRPLAALMIYRKV